MTPSQMILLHKRMNFISSRREITQVTEKSQMSTSLSKIIKKTNLL